MYAAGKNREPGRRWDHLLPAMILVVGGGLLEVWASWLAIASVSGFPRIGRMTTGWILPVTTEAYWTVALFAWLVIPAGPRSRKFAMWSAAGVFTASLTGQESGHLVAAAGGAANPFVVGLVTALPLTAVALGAVLIHLRQADWEAADAAERAQDEAAQRAAELRAETDERTVLRAQIAGLQETLAAAETARDEAARDAALRAEAYGQRDEMQAQMESAQQARQAADAARSEAENAAGELAVKLADVTRRLERAAGRRKAPAGRRQARAGQMPRDFDKRAEALRLLSADPSMSGAELARQMGMSERWGQDRKKEFASHVPDPVTGTGSGE